MSLGRSVSGWRLPEGARPIGRTRLPHRTVGVRIGRGAAIGAADCVIAVGSILSRLITRYGTPVASAKVIHLAAIAQPKRTVLCVAGDGGFMQDLQEVDTVERFSPNVVTVVMNDESLGAEYHELGAKHLDLAKSMYEPRPECDREPHGRARAPR